MEYDDQNVSNHMPMTNLDLVIIAQALHEVEIVGHSSKLDTMRDRFRRAVKEQFTEEVYERFDFAR